MISSHDYCEDVIKSIKTHISVFDVLESLSKGGQILSLWPPVFPSKHTRVIFFSFRLLLNALSTAISFAHKYEYMRPHSGGLFPEKWGLIQNLASPFTCSCFVAVKGEDRGCDHRLYRASTTLPLPDYVTSDKLLNSSESQFSYL